MALIYIDKSGFQSETTRLYSYKVKGLHADEEYNWQLKSTSVLIMDNATFHKGKKLIEVIKSVRHYIVWLPKYSPDLNPIEKM